MPRWSSCASRSALEDSRDAEHGDHRRPRRSRSRARTAPPARRVRRPSAPVRRTSAAVSRRAQGRRAWRSPRLPAPRRGRLAASGLAGARTVARPPVAHLDAARERGGDRGVVRDRHDRRARRVQLLQQREDVRAGAGVQVAGGLVGEQDRGAADQRAGDRDALALAARELRRRVASTGAPARPPRAPRAPAPAARPARRRRRAARSRRCRARSSRRAGRTAGTRTRSSAPAARPARARPAPRCSRPPRAPRPTTAARACPSRAAASTCPSRTGRRSRPPRPRAP